MRLVYELEIALHGIIEVLSTEWLGYAEPVALEKV